MNLLERLRPFRAFDLIPLGGTLSLLGALWLLTRVWGSLGGGDDTLFSETIGSYLAWGASLFCAAALTDRRAAGLLLFGLALVSGLSVLELELLLRFWPASDNATSVLILAALFAFPAAWRAGGLLVASLPGSQEEWRLRLLLLGIALFITALRLAWRWRRR